MDKFSSPPITPMKARAVKSFPVAPDWMYEPKWDGFRCLVFRDDENVFLQSRTGKNLTSGFPEIVAAFRALSPKRFVQDVELAMPTDNGFSFDGLVNRLRIGSARLALEVRDSPAIYIVFDMLANSENLLGSPFGLRRKTLERFFKNWVPRSAPLYLSASGCWPVPASLRNQRLPITIRFDRHGSISKGPFFKPRWCVLDSQNVRQFDIRDLSPLAVTQVSSA